MLCWPLLPKIVIAIVLFPIWFPCLCMYGLFRYIKCIIKDVRTTCALTGVTLLVLFVIAFVVSRTAAVRTYFDSLS